MTMTMILDGTMGSDFEFKQAGNFPLLKVDVAYYMGKNDQGEPLTEWITLQFWKQWMIEKLPAQYGKGSKVVVSGQAKFKQYYSNKHSQWMKQITVDVDAIWPKGDVRQATQQAGTPGVPGQPGVPGGTPAGGIPPSPFGGTRPAQGPPPGTPAMQPAGAVPGQLPAQPAPPAMQPAVTPAPPAAVPQQPVQQPVQPVQQPVQPAAQPPTSTGPPPGAPLAKVPTATAGIPDEDDVDQTFL